jgi:membrane-bound serine protease (ClpP class)
MINRSWLMILFLSLILAIPLMAALGTAGEDKVDDNRAVVAHIVVDGPISPVSADYIQKEVERAESEGLDLVILQLDTPGGLMTSTRQIVKTLLGSEVPIAVHVAPPGARAASAGVFITMAAHVAAMAPGTNIGAAHPVNIGGGNPLSPKKEEKEEKGEGEEEKKTEGESGGEGEGEKKPAEGDESVMGQKVLNDTVAFVRSIAEKQGRNADWGEKAVRESASVTETKALELNVIDIIAEDVDDLLAAIEGMSVKISGEEVVLAVAGGEVIERPMGWRHRVLGALSDPNVAYILMMLGIYGLFFELANPGVILPGVLGGIFLILAFFSLQVIPFNYAGILLIIVAVILFILELSLSLVVGVTIFTALFFVVGLGLAIRVQRKRPTTGAEGLVGETGVVTVTLAPEGTVKVRGEIWKAVAERISGGNIETGSKVRVKAVEGMMVKVEEIGLEGGIVKEEEGR